MSKDYEDFMEKGLREKFDEANEDLQVTIDISMYPTKEDFIPPIKDFIEKINTYPDLKIITSPTSTIVQGKFNYAMQSIQECMLACHKEFRNIYVMKVIPGYEAFDR
tara:strand:- start:2437 stop:2757 length:321 start_codon:yes stop_codon:yes gene_type:complete